MCPVPNLYVSLNTLKDAGLLGLTATTNDTQLLRTAEEASRQIERDTNRTYWIYEGTRYQDGAATRCVLDFDVQSITNNTTGLCVDIDGSNTWASAYTVDINSPTSAPDAYCYPQDTYPKTRLEANPYGSYGHLGAGVRKAIRINGTFGYGNDWPADYKHTATVVTGAALASTDATMSISGNSTGEVSGGMTLRVGSEQIYVTAQPTGSLNSTAAILRAQNGTAAAAATTGTAISIYDYPAPIVQGTIIQCIRLWKRRESGFVNTVVNTDMGSVSVFKGTDPDYEKICAQYRRLRIPRYL